MQANLSYKDTYGYYGLRVGPSFDHLVKTFGKKPVKVPVPKDRKFKYYALGPYRALLLDASKKYHNFEQQKLAYESSGAELPDAAAGHTMYSDAAYDEAWQRQLSYNDDLDAYEAALDAANEEYRQQQQQTSELRSQQLSSYGPNLMHPVIEAHSEQLKESEVPHALPAPRSPMPQASWPTENQQYASAGIPQAPQFPTYEALNRGETLRLRQSSNIDDQVRALRSMQSYEQLRREAREQLRQVARRRSDVD